MVESIPLAEMRKSIGKAFNRAHFYNEVIRVDKHGDPFVAVVSNADGDTVEDVRELAKQLDMEPASLVDRLKKLADEPRLRKLLTDG